jgi:hypothetical protein
MNEETKGQAGLSGGIAGAGQLLSAQYAAQFGHYRTQALQIALQANAGAPRKVSDIIADAELILAWIVPQPAP